MDKARKLIKLKPLVCGTFITEEKSSVKYIGDLFDSRGLGSSVLTTIKERLGKAKGECREISMILEDWRSQSIGGFQAGIKLYEACAVPALLYNSETWTEIPKEAEELLEKFQNWFVRLIMRIGPGCPRVALRSETGLLSMKLRIWIRKALLIRHICNLEPNSLAFKVWE